MFYWDSTQSAAAGGPVKAAAPPRPEGMRQTVICRAVVRSCAGNQGLTAAKADKEIICTSA